MSVDRLHDRPDELMQFESDFWAIAAGADDLAFRGDGYHILMSSRRCQPEPRHFTRWAEVVTAMEALDPRALGLEPLTERYVTDIHRALHTFARVRDGAAISYLDQVAAYLDLRDIWIPERELLALQERIVTMLGDRGLPDDLARGLETWARERNVAAVDIPAYCRPLIEASKQASLALGIPIPKMANVDISVRSTPYYAYAHYHGDYRGTVELTSDLPWTPAALKHSICHEAFPGHQASASAKEWAVEKQTWAEIHLPGLANSPTSPISEGLAENSARMLGWIDTEDDLLFSLQNRLQFGARTNAAIMRHQHGAPREDVVAYMMREAGVTRDWALYKEGFITDPLWHTSFPHYWHGTTLIDGALAQFAGRERDLFMELFGRPQTTGTLRELMAEDALAREDAVSLPTPGGTA